MAAKNRPRNFKHVNARPVYSKAVEEHWIKAGARLIGETGQTYTSACCLTTFDWSEWNRRNRERPGLRIWPLSFGGGVMW
jgi:hypothetical protein